MNLYQLRAFSVLSQTLHYQRTADILNISQPSLSRTIRNLEDELGVPLFEKQGRNVKLTEYGTVMAAHVTRSVQELDLGLERIREMTDPDRMNIYLSVNYYLSMEYLPRLTASYLKEHPEKEYFFQFSQGNTPKILEELRKGTSELGFCSFMEDQPDIKYVPIIRIPLHVVCATDHPLAKKGSATFSEVAEYPLILSTDKTYFIDGLFQSRGLKPRVIFRMGEDHAIANLVRYNFGISVLPYSEQLNACGVVQVPLEDENAYRIFYLATCRNHSLSPAARAFYQYVRKAGEDILEI